MNDRKPIDRTQVPKPIETERMQAENLCESQAPDLRRRRLIRGAAGVAPLVLTLRSGALAAGASCTGVNSDPGTGIIPYSADTNGNLSPGTSLSPGTGQACVTDWAGCATGGPTDTHKITGTAPYQGVVVANNGVTGCSTDNGTTFLKNTSNIAIMSNGAYTSFITS